MLLLPLIFDSDSKTVKVIQKNKSTEYSNLTSATSFSLSKRSLLVLLFF